MLRRFVVLTLALGIGCLSAAEKGTSIGVVDFGKCVENSKLGKAEQESFESIKMRMHKTIEDLDSQLSETASKLQDKDLLDSLSPEAEMELKGKFQALSEEMNRYQGQYYQIMQQANMKFVQTMAEMIGRASEVVADQEGYALIINREAAFHFAKRYDVTEKVIKELDKIVEKEAQMAQANAKITPPAPAAK